MGTFIASIALGITMLGSIGIAATIAHAQATAYPAPMMIDIDGSGNVSVLRGTVQSTGANSITLQSWGGSTWTIDTTDDSAVTPVGPNGAGDLSGITTGDFVGVSGTLDQNNSMTVDASVVHDWTTPSTSTTATVGSSITSAISTPIISATTSLYTGTVSSTDGNPLMITDQSGNSYNIDASAATLWNTAGNTITLANIQPNDSLRIDGTLSGNTISASIIRDISQ